MGGEGAGCLEEFVVCDGEDGEGRDLEAGGGAVVTCGCIEGDEEGAEIGNRHPHLQTHSCFSVTSRDEGGWGEAGEVDGDNVAETADDA